jgi:hypothetical protein
MANFPSEVLVIHLALNKRRMKMNHMQTAMLLRQHHLLLLKRHDVKSEFQVSNVLQVKVIALLPLLYSFVL